MTLAEGYKREIEENNMRDAVPQSWAARLPTRSSNNNNNSQASGNRGSHKRQRTGNTVPMETYDSDTSSLDESSVGEPGQHVKFPMDVSPDTSYTR